MLCAYRAKYVLLIIGKMPAPPVGLIGMRRAMESDAIFPEVTWRATPPDGVFESRNEEQQLQGGSAVYPQPPIHGGTSNLKVQNVMCLHTVLCSVKHKLVHKNVHLT